MAQFIPIEGEPQEISPANGTDFTLGELQTLVGGIIEIVQLHHGQILVVNEEGLLKGLPLNTLASLVYLTHGGNTYIVGNALLCGTEEVR
jgi:Domain of unknown function (DUF3846)